jgi:flavin-dependent dehydrogenase
MASERLALMGAGISGVYLAAMIKKAVVDVEADLYDLPGARLGCACAWGTEIDEFRRYMNYLDIDAESLIMRHINRINFQDVWQTQTTNFCTINRIAMIKAILHRYKIKVHTETPFFPDYDRIIDCTGHARAFLPSSLGTDLKIKCRQVIVTADDWDPHECTIIFGNIGYGWKFPLGKRIYHVGYGELGNDAYLRKWYKRTIADRAAICDCANHFKKPEKVRLSPPSQMLPFTGTNVSIVMNTESSQFVRPVIGVAEAVGCVSPVAGEGIVPALRCADLLLENFNDVEAYQKAVLKEFKWMDKEFKVIQNFIKGNDWRGILGFMRCFSNGRRFGIESSWRDWPHLLKVLRTWRKRK